MAEAFVVSTTRFRAEGSERSHTIEEAFTEGERFGFGYDANGNRMSETIAGLETDYSHQAESNRLEAISAAALTHDAADKRTADRNGGIGERSFEYNEAVRLFRVYESGQVLATCI